MLTISLNNSPRHLDHPMSLLQALKVWQQDSGRYAIAVNGKFVPRSQYRTFQLQDMDTIDLVKPVGGG